MTLSLMPTVLIFPWLTSSQESSLPAIFHSTDLIVIGAVLGSLSVIAVSTDFIRSSLQ
jgi:hypothetical protein